MNEAVANSPALPEVEQQELFADDMQVPEDAGYRAPVVAKIVGITKAGHLSVGARADVCVFDPATHVTVTREGLRSQGKNTPFLGMELLGKVRYTLVEGQVMFES